MERVAVVGPGGAGKSTFSDRLGERTGLPVVHLDRHYWRPGWVEPPKDEWRSIQGELVAADRWIIDGNYGATFDLRFAVADTLIVYQPGRLTCLRGVSRRVMASRGRAVQAEGCAERVDLAFLRWIWRYPVDSRPRLDAAIGRHRHLSVVTLRSRRAAADFLGRVAPVA